MKSQNAVAKKGLFRGRKHKSIRYAVIFAEGEGKHLARRRGERFNG